MKFHSISIDGIYFIKKHITNVFHIRTIILRILSYKYLIPFSGMNVFVMFRAIWYHLYNLKSVKYPPWKSVTFSKVAGFTKSNTPLWVLFTFFNLYKWYQIEQPITFTEAYFSLIWDLAIQKQDLGLRAGLLHHVVRCHRNDTSVGELERYANQFAFLISTPFDAFEKPSVF